MYDVASKVAYLELRSVMVAKRQPRSGFLRILLWVFPITLRFQQIAMIVLYDVLSLHALGVVIASAR